MNLSLFEWHRNITIIFKVSQNSGQILSSSHTEYRAFFTDNSCLTLWNDIEVLFDTNEMTLKWFEIWSFQIKNFCFPSFPSKNRSLQDAMFLTIVFCNSNKKEDISKILCKTKPQNLCNVQDIEIYDIVLFPFLIILNLNFWSEYWDTLYFSFLNLTKWLFCLLDSYDVITRPWRIFRKI